MITTSKLGVYLLVCAACAFSAPLDSNNVSSLAAPEYRLSQDVKPIAYKIELRPYLEDNEEKDKKRFDFDGEVYIQLSTEKDNIDKIILHSKDLNLEKPVLRHDDEPIEVTLKPANETTDKITVELNGGKKLEKKKIYVLYFKFNGKLSSDMHGFYKSQFKRGDKDVFLASTQFQPGHARRAFPCFDEPLFKAKFQVTIKHHKNYNAISNMKLKDEPKIEGNVKTSIFLETPTMSTYILAFLISDFEENFDIDKTNFKVIARTEYKNQTTYSLNIGQKLLKEFNTYTKIDYDNNMGNEKMHLAAIPDFSAGAMENWGLLTFRERALLYDDIETTLSAQQSIATIIAHEQAHMWFGDYVTCEWWSYTWLNEGFARYFQYFLTHKVEPKWQMDKQFVVDQIHSVFVMDSLNETNPMTDNSVEAPVDVKRMFNSISYNKGAAVIRMFAYSMGESKFQNALRDYLKKKKHQTSVPQDLFDSLLAQFKENEKELMQEYFEDWTTKPGYPVVTITAAGNSVIVTQKHFELKLNAKSKNLEYTVPLTFSTNTKPNFKDPKVIYLQKSDSPTKIELGDEKFDWVVANVNQNGYYRVNYDEETWHNIHHALMSEKFSGIPEINRAQIIDDLMNFGISGLLKYDLILDILDYLKVETNYIPWTAAFNGFKNIAIRLDEKNKKDFGKYILKLIEKVYQLGFEEVPNDTHLDILNRAKVLSWACKYGNKECISKSKELFSDLKENNQTVPKNIRSPVYCTAIREGSLEEFEFLWGRYLNSNVATEQVLILNTLGCVKNNDEIQNYYKKILKEIRLQDRSAALTSLFSENSENAEKVFKLIAANYKDLSTALGGDSEMALVLSNIASKFTTESQKKLLEAFLIKNKELGESEKKILKKSIETVKENLEWSNKILVKFNEIVKKKIKEVENEEDEPEDKDDSASLVQINFLVLILTIIVFII